MLKKFLEKIYRKGKRRQAVHKTKKKILCNNDVIKILVLTAVPKSLFYFIEE